MKDKINNTIKDNINAEGITRLIGFNLRPVDIFASICSAFCAGNLILQLYAKNKAWFGSLDFMKIDSVTLILACSTLMVWVLLLMVSIFVKSILPVKLSLLIFATAYASCLANSAISESINICIILGLAFVLYFSLTMYLL